MVNHKLEITNVKVNICVFAYSYIEPCLLWSQHNYSDKNHASCAN